VNIVDPVEHLGHLPVRPRPFLGESLRGYFRRVAMHNGYVSDTTLLSSAGQETSPLLTRVAQQLKLSEEELARLGGWIAVKWGSTVAGKELDSQEFNHIWQRWCPACLRDEPFMRATWELKLVTVCVRHGCWLVDKCGSCGARQSWREPTLHQCQCGRDFSTNETTSAEATVLALTDHLTHKFLGHSGDGFWPAVPFNQMSRAIRYLGGFGIGSVPKRPGKVPSLHQLDIAQAHLQRAAFILMSWPSGLQFVLRDMHARATPNISLNRTFSPLYRVIYDKLSQPCFQPVRDVFEAYVRQSWDGLLGKRNRRLSSQTVNEHPQMTIRRAAAILGVERTAAEQIAKDAGLLVEVAMKSGRHAQSMHAHAVSQLKDKVHGCVTLGVAATMMSLPERRVRELIAGQVLPVLVSRAQAKRRAAWLISRQDIERFLIKPFYCGGDDHLTVRSFLKYGCLQQGEAVALVQAILSGDLPTYGLSDADVPVGDAKLSKQEVRTWLVTWRSAIRTTMNVDQAARRLKIKQQVAYQLVKAGLLSACNDPHNGWQVSIEGLNRFSLEFVSLADLARERGCAPRWLLENLSAVPVCGPNIDRTRQYFYRRVELCEKPIPIS
jgi:TniQ